MFDWELITGYLLKCSQQNVATLFLQSWLCPATAKRAGWSGDEQCWSWISTFLKTLGGLDGCKRTLKSPKHDSHLFKTVQVAKSEEYVSCEKTSKCDQLIFWNGLCVLHNLRQEKSVLYPVDHFLSSLCCVDSAGRSYFGQQTPQYWVE